MPAMMDRIKKPHPIPGLPMITPIINPRTPVPNILSIYSPPLEDLKSFWNTLKAIYNIIPANPLSTSCALYH